MPKILSGNLVRRRWLTRKPETAGRRVGAAFPRRGADQAATRRVDASLIQWRARPGT